MHSWRCVEVGRYLLMDILFGARYCRIRQGKPMCQDCTKSIKSRTNPERLGSKEICRYLDILAYTILICQAQILLNPHVKDDPEVLTYTPTTHQASGQKEEREPRWGSGNSYFYYCALDGTFEVC